MNVTILGSGTLYPDAARHSAAHFVEAEGIRLLMDCGSGTVHGMARERHATQTAGDGRDGHASIEWKKLSHLALSHFHTDHVGDVPALLFALKHGHREPREEPLVVLGPPGIRSFWKALADAFGPHIADPGFPLEVVELKRTDDWRSHDGRLRIRTQPTPHTEESVAFRVETDEGVVGYTGDTGPDEALGAFMSGVDILIGECSLPDPPRMKTHMTPAGLAALAKAARPATLVATHVFPNLDPAQVPARIGEAGYEGKVVAGHDGLLLSIKHEKG